MRCRYLLRLVGGTALVSLVLIRASVSVEPPFDPVLATDATTDSAAVPGERISRVSVEVARDRATLLHEVYASTLDVMHQRYFHGDRAIVPARAMEDVFSEMQSRYAIEARWIAVTLRAMSIDHDPETTFEKMAAREIKSGKSEVEEVQSGFYRRAVAIPLSGGCVNCHAGSLSQSTRKHFAGLVISIPINPSKSKIPD